MQDLFDFQIFAVTEHDEGHENVKGQASAEVLIIAQVGDNNSIDNLAFLEKVLEAVQLSPMEKKTALLLLQASDQISIAGLSRVKSCHTILLFGIDPSAIGIRAELPYYRFTRVSDLQLLRAHSLDVIRAERAQNNNQKAGALWQALKVYFLNP